MTTRPIHADYLHTLFDDLVAASHPEHAYDPDAALALFRATRPGAGLLWHSGGGFVHALAVFETTEGLVLAWTSPDGCGLSRAPTSDAVDAFCTTAASEDPLPSQILLHSP